MEGYDFKIYGKRTGKRSAMKQWIQEQLDLGNEIAIVDKDGMFCAKHDKPWEECVGSHDK